MTITEVLFYIYVIYLAQFKLMNLKQRQYYSLTKRSRSTNRSKLIPRIQLGNGTENSFNSFADSVKDNNTVALPSISRNPDSTSRLRLVLDSEKKQGKTKRKKYSTEANKKESEMKEIQKQIRRDQMKRKMMKIFEYYSLLPKRENPDIIEQKDLITTDELFKKMHIMLSPNKKEMMNCLKYKMNIHDPDFLEKMQNIDREIELENKLRKESSDVSSGRISRKMSTELRSKQKERKKKSKSPKINVGNNRKNSFNTEEEPGRQRSFSLYAKLKKIQRETDSKNKNDSMARGNTTHLETSNDADTVPKLRLHRMENIEEERKNFEDMTPDEQKKDVFKNLVNKIFKKKKEEKSEEKEKNSIINIIKKF